MHTNCLGGFWGASVNLHELWCVFVWPPDVEWAARSWQQACPRRSRMPSEATEVSEGGLWKIPFSFISINKVAFLNEFPLSFSLPPLTSSVSLIFDSSPSQSFPSHPSLGQCRWCFVFVLFLFCFLCLPFTHLLIKWKWLLSGAIAGSWKSALNKKRNLFFLPFSDIILYDFPQSMLNHQSHQNHWGQLVKNTDSWTLPQPGRAQRPAFIHALTVSLMHAAVGRTNYHASEAQAVPRLPTTFLTWLFLLM